MPLNCSFCGKSQSEVDRLIAGIKGQICDECVAVCLEIAGESTVREGRLQIRAGIALAAAHVDEFAELLERERALEAMAVRKRPRR